MSTHQNDNERNESQERTRLASLLKEAREYLGFSQDQVAQHLGIARSALSNVENGQRKVDVVELKRFAALYKKPVTYFTGEPGAPASSVPDDVELLTRKASNLSPKDRVELARFADFLRSRSGNSSGGTAGGK